MRRADVAEVNDHVEADGVLRVVRDRVLAERHVDEDEVLREADRREVVRGLSEG